MRFLRFLKHQKGFIIFAVLFESLFLSLSFACYDTEFLMGLCLVIAGFGGLMMFKLLQHAWKNFDKIIENEQKNKEFLARKKTEMESMEQMWKQGEWTISAFEYFLSLRAQKVEMLDSEYSIKQAAEILTQFLESNHIPKEFWKNYLSDRKIREIFDMGCAEFDRRTREPQKSDPKDGAVCVEIKWASSLVNKTGVQKRLDMLQHAATRLKIEAQKFGNMILIERAKEEDRDRELKSLGVAMIQASQQKTANWGLAGGVAEGIAGPVAGVVAAASVMQKNAEIEKRNAFNKAYYSDVAAKMLTAARQSYNSYDMEMKRDALLKEADNMIRKIKENENKVVLEDISTKDIKQHIRLRLVDVVRDKHNVLNVEIRIKNSYVPPKVNMVVDGVISADVYSGEIYVGTAHIPFPLYGIPSNQTVNLVGLCPCYLEGDHKYTVKYTYHNLWVMEQ